PAPESWLVLDAEADARTPSPAQRTASRAQGKALLRAALTTWPSPVLEALSGVHREHRTPDGRGPHHPVVLGIAAFAAHGTPYDAAAIAAYGAVSGSASAAVRLLGLDPLSVHRALAELSPDVDAVAREAAEYADGEWADLPAASAPLLDVWAELHLRADLRLFES
ncbi:urease accessory UreF family protein, partial [Actinocorallia aurantiaca]